MNSDHVFIGVHGINVTFPQLTINKFRGAVEFYGAEYDAFTYGHMNIGQIHWVNRLLAQSLVDRIEHWLLLDKKVHVVCHSNGAAILHLAHRIIGHELESVICVNPALKQDLIPYASAKQILVAHNEEDRVVEWARLFTLFTFGAVDLRPWGEMGRYGYQGAKFAKLTNFDTAEGPYPALGHSGLFFGAPAFYWIPLLISRALNLPAPPLFLGAEGVPDGD